ncbi:piwi-like protein Ago3 [Euwallacea fornicatus]|uniref:piwi-like protein Ago3 n=1 Tax=Euwallacea fornicatus TaxID=995702 RepID=UPI00338EDAEC
MAEGGPPAPRGRGQILAQLLKKQKEATQSVGIAPEESKLTPQPKGRAALLKKILEGKRVGAAADTQQAFPSSTSQKPGSAVRKEETSSNTESSIAELPGTVSQMTISEPQEPTLYQGTSGKQINISLNYLRLDLEKGRGVFEYEVKFNPEIDAKNHRVKLVNQVIRGQLETAKMFDGGNILYLPVKITDTQKIFTAELPGSNEEVILTVVYKKQKSLGDRDCLHLYNILFKRIMHVLLYTQMGRNYFNPEHRHLIPQHKLEVFPGFAVTVDEREGGLMLTLDTQHRVLRTQNAYELLYELKTTTNPKMFKETVQKNFLGSCVFTRYNNKTYIIDDVLWDMTPMDTFPTRDGRNITFVDYYKAQYNITIRDHDQPLLLNRKKVKKSGSTELEDRMVCLIPELSFLTGLTDTMRSDYKVMKDVAMYTRVTPNQRILALRTYLENVKKSEKAQQILSDWGLSIPSTGYMNVSGRQLEMEKVIFGNQVTKMAGPGADWNRDLGNNSVTGPVDLYNWVVFFTEQDSRYARDFSQHMTRLATSLGCVISPPRMERLPNDQPATYVNYVKDKINPNMQLAVFICPTMRSDRYALIKKLCCSQIPIASQVINSRTLSKPDKVRSIILKIALQINCKLGGSLWTVKFPFQGWMICGIDVYHGSPPNSVCGFVSSLNESVSRWYSTALFQRSELGDFYKKAFTKSLEQYKSESGSFPSKVIIIRDGVGDGQLESTKKYEVRQFEDILQQFCPNTTICFIVVQKRINTRIFGITQGQAENPPPGTILDHTVTQRHLHDFYMVPQSVRQGTVNPTHYIVLHDTCNLKPDHVQRLCYKLCHLYYNWPGTIKVPAPCQYAHKLAAMVGQHIKTQPSPELADKLWYL